ncbi:hypothetical protein [Rhizobium sp. Root1203]|uniref:hypothetical protein n=1 Tax=Rhizobium sp. Root1203 TaxID=1736427 RepID=UPI001FCD814A|nr:hypothetical protein [Rhizobium sp. Root1203]
MIDTEMFAPELYGFWPQRRDYRDMVRPAWSEAEARAAVEEYFLETKSGDAPPAEELRVLLNEMTAEMRDQFAAFRTLRKAAESAAAGSSDETAAKLARADLKAATDAMSLIVRTLEKIDQLQRQVARDRELAADENDVAVGLENAKKGFLERIEELAAQRANELLAAWKATGPPGPRDAPVVWKDPVEGEVAFAGEAPIESEHREAETAGATEPR